MKKENVKQTVKIRHPQDLITLNPDIIVRIEIYLRDYTFQFTDLNADLIIRAEGCAFPNLSRIQGSLSIDARNGDFPELTAIEGNLTLHYAAELDKLEHVGGDLKSQVDFDFKNDIDFRHRISLTKCQLKVMGQPVPGTAKTRFISIAHQDQVMDLPTDGVFNLKVTGNNITIWHKEIHGKIILTGYNTRFPNLTHVKGSLHMGSGVRENLQYGYGTYYFPQLKEVGGNLLVKRSRVDFEKLEKIHGELLHEDNFGAEVCLEFPRLRYMKRYRNSYNLVAEQLERISFYDSCYTNSVVLPKLKQIDNYVYNEKLEIDKFAKNIYFRLNQNGGLYVSKDGFMRYEPNWRNANRLKPLPLKKAISIFKLKYKTFDEFLANDVLRNWQIHEHRDFYRILLKIERLWKQVKAFRPKELMAINIFRSNPFMAELYERYVPLSFLMDNSYSAITSEEIVSVRCYSRELKDFSWQPVTFRVYELFPPQISRHQHNYVRISLEAILNKELPDGQPLYFVMWINPVNGTEEWDLVDAGHKNEALSAYASLFDVHENVIAKLTALKRINQEIFCELSEEIIPSGTKRTLSTKELVDFFVIEI
ncbi:hypothetical protein GCM10007415_42260 [Parapedobacter pyrenivorans]|uniref:Uncharacterized protein n=1 Tax=Parapedobacter pyrenivorans TaxID=1305674 RepID=A0A917I1K1_9SPHI|nr:hypothetical protein [Parapedobacter pyrenivorans]GGH01681.1 hypothetical protein GCM10007415_42260 [Parapedobacter pyrenivorans]